MTNKGKITLLELRYELEKMLKKKQQMDFNEYYYLVTKNGFVTTLLDVHKIELTFLDLKELRRAQFMSPLLDEVDDLMQTDTSAWDDDNCGLKQAIKTINYCLGL